MAEPSSWDMLFHRLDGVDASLHDVNTKVDSLAERAALTGASLSALHDKIDTGDARVKAEVTASRELLEARIATTQAEVQRAHARIETVEGRTEATARIRSDHVWMILVAAIGAAATVLVLLLH